MYLLCKHKTLYNILNLSLCSEILAHLGVIEYQYLHQIKRSRTEAHQDSHLSSLEIPAVVI